MNIGLSMSDLLKKATGQYEPINVSAETPLECVQALVTRFPDLNKWLYQEPGKLKSHVWLLVNDERIYANDYQKPLQDKDQLFIMIAVLGG